MKPAAPKPELEKVKIEETSVVTRELRDGFELMSRHFDNRFMQVTDTLTGAMQAHTDSLYRLEVHTRRLDERTDRTEKSLESALERLADLEAGRVHGRPALGHAPVHGRFGVGHGPVEEAPRVDRALAREMRYAEETTGRRVEGTPHVACIPPLAASPKFESSIKQPQLPPPPAEGQRGLATIIPSTAEAIIKATQVNDDEKFETDLRRQMDSSNSKNSITPSAIRALLEGKLRRTVLFCGRTVAGSSPLMPVPLGPGLRELVEGMYSDKLRYCFLQEHDVALFILCLEEHTGIKRMAIRELPHGTSLRVCVYWLSQRCPHHGEPYESNRWAGLKSFKDAAAIIRAQDYKGDICALQVLTVIQEFGTGRTNRDLVDMAIALLPTSVMQMLTGHLAPRERAAVDFGTLLINATNVLEVLQAEAPAIQETSRKPARGDTQIREKKSDGWGGLAGGALASEQQRNDGWGGLAGGALASEQQKNDDWGGLAGGALAGVQYCKDCAAFGIPEGEHFFQDQLTGQCPLTITEISKRRAAFYMRIQHLWKMGILSEKQVAPFKAEFESRLDSEPGFKEAVQEYHDRVKAKWSSKGGGRGGKKTGSERSVTVPRAGRHDDPSSRSTEIGLGPTGNTRTTVNMLIISGSGQANATTAIVVGDAEPVTDTTGRAPEVEMVDSTVGRSSDAREQVLALSARCGPREGNALVVGMAVIGSSPERTPEQSQGTQDVLMCDACEELEACYRRSDNGLMSCAECAAVMDDCELILLGGGTTGEPLQSSALVMPPRFSPESVESEQRISNVGERLQMDRTGQPLYRAEEGVSRGEVTNREAPAFRFGVSSEVAPRPAAPSMEERLAQVEARNQALQKELANINASRSQESNDAGRIMDELCRMHQLSWGPPGTEDYVKRCEGLAALIDEHYQASLLMEEEADARAARMAAEEEKAAARKTAEQMEAPEQDAAQDRSVVEASPTGYIFPKPREDVWFRSDDPPRDFDPDFAMKSVVRQVFEAAENGGMTSGDHERWLADKKRREENGTWVDCETLVEGIGRHQGGASKSPSQPAPEFGDDYRQRSSLQQHEAGPSRNRDLNTSESRYKALRQLAARIMHAEPEGAHSEAAWDPRRLRVGSRLVVLEGPWAGELGTAIGGHRRMGTSDPDAVEIVLTHRQRHTERTVMIRHVQPVPSPVFDYLEEMFGEMLTRQQDPEGIRLGRGKVYDHFEARYAQLLPEPRPLEEWEYKRIDMVTAQLQDFMTLKQGQKTKSAQTDDSDYRWTCLEECQKHPWCMKKVHENQKCSPFFCGFECAVAYARRVASMYHPDRMGVIGGRDPKEDSSFEDEEEGPDDWVDAEKSGGPEERKPEGQDDIPKQAENPDAEDRDDPRVSDPQGPEGSAEPEGRRAGEESAKPADMVRIVLKATPRVSLRSLGVKVANPAEDMVEVCQDIAEEMAANKELPLEERVIFAKALVEASEEVLAPESPARPAEPTRQRLNKDGVCLSCRKHVTGCGCLPALGPQLNDDGVCLTCRKHRTGCRCTPSPKVTKAKRTAGTPTARKMAPPMEQLALTEEDLGEFGKFLEDAKKKKEVQKRKGARLGMMAVGALAIEEATPEERKWPNPIGMRDGFVPPKSFLESVPRQIDGTCLLARVRMYHKDLGAFIALLDLGAQIPVVLSSKLPKEAWEFKVKVDGKLFGFAGDTNAEYLVPVSVAIGTTQTHGLWFWAIPLEQLPHDNVDVVIDYATCTALLENLDFDNPAMVKINVRSREDLEKQIKFFRDNDMKGTWTACVPRRYALADFDPLE